MFLDEFYRSLDFLSQRFITFKQPVLLSEVVLPHPSLTLRSEGYEIHRLIPERVAARLLVKAPERTAQPLYLSRAKLRKLTYMPANEDRLMEILAEKGYAIAYPERLTLEQQIYLINKHDTIIGLMGSALHGVLFDLSPEASKNVVCLAEKVSSVDSRVRTYMVIDMIKSIKSTYIFAIDAVNSTDWKIRNEGAVLDLETTLRGLRDSDLL
jgi:capsular polysaccharide biosynthesis protein